MSAEVLDAVPAEFNGASRSMYGYYKKPDGWITCAVYSPMEQLAYLQEGWKSLPQYGTFDMVTGWAANHPFEVLFMRGGAKEMSIEQIKESGFHILAPQYPSCNRPLNPKHNKHTIQCMPMVNVVFPQMNGIHLESYPCQFDTCPTKRNQPENSFSSLKARNQHEMVMHKEEKSDIRTGTVLAESLLRGFSGMGTPSVPTTNQPDILTILNNVGFTAAQKKALVAAGVLQETPVEDTNNGE